MRWEKSHQFGNARGIARNISVEDILDGGAEMRSFTMNFDIFTNAGAPTS